MSHGGSWVWLGIGRVVPANVPLRYGVHAERGSGWDAFVSMPHATTDKCMRACGRRTTRTIPALRNYFFPLIRHAISMTVCLLLLSALCFSSQQSERSLSRGYTNLAPLLNGNFPYPLYAVRLFLFCVSTCSLYPVSCICRRAVFARFLHLVSISKHHFFGRTSCFTKKKTCVVWFPL